MNSVPNVLLAADQLSLGTPISVLALRSAASHPPAVFVDLHRPVKLVQAPKILALVTTFRMNTCKSVSKQRTLTTFRMNTYAKPRGRGSYC